MDTTTVNIFFLKSSHVLLSKWILSYLKYKVILKITANIKIILYVIEQYFLPFQ